MSRDFMLTSESVTEGHPDKLCDQISDAIVDHFLQEDSHTRVIAECAVSTAIVFIAAMFESRASIDFAAVARDVIRNIGYNKKAFNYQTCSVITSLKELAHDITRDFNEFEMTDDEMNTIVVKNNATIFGFACKQSPSLIPLPIWLAHKVAMKLSEVRRGKVLPYITPDGKVQVGVEYHDRVPARIHSIIVQVSQNDPVEPLIEKLRSDVMETVVLPVFESEDITLDKDTRIYVNPDGPSITGGPAVHAGLTGRKKAIDTYGGYSRHSDAALSGKGPLRIDRVGAYMARYAAKNVVAAGLANECEVQVSYTIGLPKPVSVQVETYGTGNIPDEEISQIIKKRFDFRLPAILKRFDLRRLPARYKEGFYKRLAAYGHVGRTDMTLPWEKTDMVDALR